MNVIIKKVITQIKQLWLLSIIRKPYILEQKCMKTIQHKNDTRKKSYLSRHTHDNYTNPLYPSFYATNLLWNKKNINRIYTRYKQ